MKKELQLNESLATLGHGKWKRALGCTLLLIGFVLGMGGMNAWGQTPTPVPDALKLDKQFIPDDETGHSGTIVLETYVTGTIEHVTTSQPTDIVLVLDASHSMATNYMDYTRPNGSTLSIKRITALQIAARSFIDQIYQDSQNSGFGGEGNENYDHRIAVVTFSQTAVLQSTAAQNAAATSDNYYDALVPVQQYYESRLGTSLTGTGIDDLNNGDATAMDNGRIYEADEYLGNGTVMATGLNAAAGILNGRSTNGRGSTFVAPGTTVELPRNMVVVFFTDGYPTTSGHDNVNYWPKTGGGSIVTNANAAVLAASSIKTITAAAGGQTVHPSVYSIAVTTGANPKANCTIYSGNTSGQQTTNGNNWVTGTACFNALLHFISSEYDGSTTARPNLNTWETPAQNATYGAWPASAEYTNDVQKYFAAENVDQLSGIFEQISSASGSASMDLGSSTKVQDVISPSFTLPEDANENSVRVYAPRYLGNGQFADTISGGVNYAGRMVLDLTTGRITDSTYENRISSEGIINIVGKNVSFQNFDFSHYYVADDEETGAARGRKLVIAFPIEIEEGVWGDGINTNTELSFVTPDGEIQYQFPIPSANVLGDVWTEIVTRKPNTFNETKNPIEIGTPEELAWFISYVNGRKDYENDADGTTYQVASHATANAILTADIDMSAHNWVPIGSGYYCNANNEYTDANGNVLAEGAEPVKLSYKGTFDGNGHVITGLKNNASKMFKKANAQGEKSVVVFPGMFANVDGGTVKNVFVLDADFRGKHHSDGFVHHGIIADTLTSGTIFNCEAVGRITTNNDTVWVKNDAGAFVVTYPDSKLVFGGLVGFNDGGTIHSSMAMATLTGYSMGGLVGENNGTLANSFTNGVYNYIGTEEQEDPENDPGMLFRYVGGLAGRNHHWTPGDNGGTFSFGTINNCYVRLGRQNDLGSDVQFGQFVGTNEANNQTGTVTNCYYPYTYYNTPLVADDNTGSYGQATNYYSDPTAPSLMRYQRSNDNMVGGTLTMKEYYINGVLTEVPVWENGTTLVDKLNANHGSYAEWKRTTAGNYVSSQNGGDINSDFPVLKLTDFTCLASTDGITLDYANSLDEMLARHNTGNMNVGTALPGEGSGHTGGGSYDYSVSQAAEIYGGTINLYANDETESSTTDNTVVYIDKNVSLLQDASSIIDAYTGQHIIDYRSTENIQSGYRWHLVSSSLQNSMFGWNYHITNQVAYPNTDAWNDFKAQWDAENPEDLLTASNPCKIWLAQADEDHELFPSDMASPNPMDFYCFYEPQYHWINFKRNSNSHWHMESPETQIIYNNELTGEGNETQFIPGKGYLMALHTEYFDDMHLWTESDNAKKDRTFIQNRGTLNNGNVDIPVTYTTDAIIDLDGYKTHLEGYNLLGNPYQSYLDFDAFANAQVNKDLWGASDTYSKTYAVYNPQTDSYEQYKSNSSKGSRAAGQYINMHQGFFIQTSQSTTAHFTNDMRSNDGTPNFRGEQPAYPLINFTVTDYEGETDLAVLELNRPENDGAKKLRMGSPAGRIYFRYDNTNLAIYFRNSDKDYQTLNFSAEEDGNFTLSWNMANADFSSLTLVDNITGIKTDMLTHDHYTFEGRMEDYNTRFKIVFGEMDTNDEEEPVLEHFAFFDHGNLIVNGTGHFEVVDVMGRVLYAVELTDTQNTVSLPSNVRGVCMLCFTRNNETKVQKMVIQ